VKARATLTVGAANLLGRVTGLARDVIFAAAFGAGVESDAYNAALRVPQLLRELVAEGSLQNVVVPAFSHEAERGGDKAAWELASAVFGALLLFLGVVTGLFWIGAELWVRLVADGFRADPAKFALAASLTRWLSPFLAGLSLSAFFGGLLNARGRFFVPALAQNVLNVGVIAACLLGADIRWVAAATTLTGFLQVLLCVPGLRAAGFSFRPRLQAHPALGKLLRWFGMAFVGVVTVQFNLLVESQWASDYGDGVLTWLLGSFRLVQLPLALVAGSLATTLIPSLAAVVARGERAEAGGLLAATLRTHNFFVVPASVGLGVLAEPIVRLVYERGAFDAADTAGTAAMLRMYAFACTGICLHRLLVPAYYALGRPRVPMWLSLGAMAAKVPVVLLLVHGFRLGANALPLSHAITVSLECVGLFVGLRALLGGRGLGGHAVRVALAAAAMGGVAAWLAPRGPVLVAIVGAAAVYGALCAALGVVALPARRPAIPPFVDPVSAGWLGRLGSGAARLDEDSVRAWVVDGALLLRGPGEALPGNATAACSGEVPGAADGFGIDPAGGAPRLVSVDLAGRRVAVSAAVLANGPPVALALPSGEKRA
jgi:putative peptidoglycan lipid II flippase